MKLKSLELFAGAGGLALGLHHAGFTPVACVENNRDAAETLRLNGFPAVQADVTTVDFTTFGPVEVVAGGAPCQSFSVAGKRLGLEDERGTLFHQFVRAVQETTPAMFLFENVPGLVNHNRGETFTHILEQFQQLPYQVSWKILDASQHGVPQKRKRLIIIGHRMGSRFAFPEPDPRTVTLREALRNVPDAPYTPYSPRKAEVLAQVPAGGCWRHLPRQVAETYMGSVWGSSGGCTGYARRLAWDKPAPTLTTSPSQKQTELCHPDQTRPLTVREYARIQTFPDTYQFAGSVAAQYRQIGNAVPVELARRLGVSLRDTIQQGV